MDQKASQFNARRVAFHLLELFLCPSLSFFFKIELYFAASSFAEILLLFAVIVCIHVLSKKKKKTNTLPFFFFFFYNAEFGIVNELNSMCAQNSELIYPQPSALRFEPFRYLLVFFTLKAYLLNRLLKGRRPAPSFLFSTSPLPLALVSPPLLAKSRKVSLFLEWKAEIEGEFPPF